MATSIENKARAICWNKMFFSMCDSILQSNYYVGQYDAAIFNVARWLAYVTRFEQLNDIICFEPGYNISNIEYHFG